MEFLRSKSNCCCLYCCLTAVDAISPKLIVLHKIPYVKELTMERAVGENAMVLRAAGIPLVVEHHPPLVEMRVLRFMLVSDLCWM